MFFSSALLVSRYVTMWFLAMIERFVVERFIALMCFGEWTTWFLAPSKCFSVIFDRFVVVTVGFLAWTRCFLVVHACLLTGF